MSEETEVPNWWRDEFRPFFAALAQRDWFEHDGNGWVDMLNPTPSHRERRECPWVLTITPDDKIPDGEGRVLRLMLSNEHEGDRILRHYVEAAESFEPTASDTYLLHPAEDFVEVINMLDTVYEYVVTVYGPKEESAHGG